MSFIPPEPFDMEGMEALTTQVPAAAGALAKTPEAPSEPVAQPETPAEPEQKVEDTPDTPEEPSLEEGLKVEETAAAEKGAADAEEAAAKKLADAEAAAKPVEEAPKDPALERDKDLIPPAEATAHMRPTTRKLIEERNKKAAEARNERDNARREAEELKKQLAEAKTRTAPKEVEDELKTLRERVRELDITKDPEIESKYDKPAVANNDQILEILKSEGFGTTADGKPDPTAIESLRKTGFNFKSLKASIDALEKAGEVDKAENIRELLRTNNRLATEKQSKISEWKTDYEARTQARTTQQQKSGEEMQTRVRETASTLINTEISEMAKTLPNVVRPQDPDPKDSPAVAAARQRQIAEYDAAAAKVQTDIAKFNTANLPPDKVAEAQGRLGAAAVKSLILSHHVLPKLQADLNLKSARIKDLEAELGKLRKAGSVSQAHAIAASSAKEAKEMSSDPVEAMRSLARERGVPDSILNS